MKNFNKVLTAAVVAIFVGICAVVLLRRQAGPGPEPGVPSTPAASSSSEMITLLLSSSNAKQTFIDKVVADFNDQRVRAGGKVVQVHTDGKDEGSVMSRADMMDALPKGDNPETIKLFTIAYGAAADKLFLKELSNRTSARTFESTTGNIGRVYQELSANF
jgi:hypothetical protein